MKRTVQKNSVIFCTLQSKKFAVRCEDPSHHQWASHPESSSDRVTQTVCLQRWRDAHLEWSTHTQPHSDIACTQTGGWNLKGLKPLTQHFCPLHSRQYCLSSPTASPPVCNDQLSGKKVKRSWDYISLFLLFLKLHLR